MMLIEENTVPDAALPLADFRAHLRLGTGFGEDSLQEPVLRGFLRAAIAAVEARTGKVLITRAFTWTLTAWRDPFGQALPVAPIRSLTRIERVDRVGVAEDVGADQYRLEQDMHRPRLRPNGSVLPMIPRDGSVVIHFDAGYGPDWQDVPADLSQAVLLLAAHYYEFRHETTLGSGCMPFGVTSLIARYKSLRLTAGRTT